MGVIATGVVIEAAAKDHGVIVRLVVDEGDELAQSGEGVLVPRKAPCRIVEQSGGRLHSDKKCRVVHEAGVRRDVK